jgi:hypothetical protein
MYQHLPLQDSPKFTQIGIFGLKYTIWQPWSLTENFFSFQNLSKPETWRPLKNNDKNAFLKSQIFCFASGSARRPRNRKDGLGSGFRWCRGRPASENSASPEKNTIPISIQTFFYWTKHVIVLDIWVFNWYFLLVLFQSAASEKWIFTHINMPPRRRGIVSAYHWGGMGRKIEKIEK